MASPLTVKVHPVVLMSIVDSYERRSVRAGMNDRALGTLLGFYEKNVVQVTNCYSIPFRETDNDIPEINDSFNRQMWQVYKRAAPTEQIVGWFFTSSDLSRSSCLYHAYYTALVGEMNVKKELPPVILLTMDVSLQVKGRLPVEAFVRGEAGVPGKSPQATIFQPVRVELDAFPGESVALQFITKGLSSARHEIKPEKGLDQLEHSTAEMVAWLEQLLAYVDGVLAAKELQPDASQVGRKLMNIVNQASTQLQPAKLEKLIENSLRDYMMTSYLAALTKTQLALQEKALNL